MTVKSIKSKNCYTYVSVYIFQYMCKKIIILNTINFLQSTILPPERPEVRALTTFKD